MTARTRELWDRQNRHPGDRQRLFAAVAEAVSAKTVLYPGSYVDIAASFVWTSVTYVDSDKRAASFFADMSTVEEIIAGVDGAPAEPAVHFIAGDFRDDLGLAPGSFDLLISLYAGFVSDHCTEYLRPGGTLLANTSHGDVALAALDPRYRLSGVVEPGDGAYRVRSDGLDGELIPAGSEPITADLVRDRGRGVAYTRSAAAYLFERR